VDFLLRKAHPAPGLETVPTTAEPLCNRLHRGTQRQLRLQDFDCFLDGLLSHFLPSALILRCSDVIHRGDAMPDQGHTSNLLSFHLQIADLFNCIRCLVTQGAVLNQQYVTRVTQFTSVVLLNTNIVHLLSFLMLREGERGVTFR
jgi:hypothetical protein